MKYIILLWPHANARYRNEAQKLARAELSVILRRVAPDARIAEADLPGMPAIALESDSPLSEDCIAALRGAFAAVRPVCRRGGRDASPARRA